MTDLKELGKKADKALAATKETFRILKKKKPSDLDDIVHSLHDEEFQKRDCLKCANCCKTTSPAFYDRDIDRLSKSLHMTPGAFVTKYLKKDEEGDYVLTTAPCPFLDPENYCTVYNSRPAACREYPHTNRKRFYQILDLTVRNTYVCPAVFDIVEKLKSITRK